MIDVRTIKLGSHLREFRTSLNMSQEKFAGMIGYTLNRISVVERKGELPVPPKILSALKSRFKNK